MSARGEASKALGDVAREGLGRLAKSVDDWGWKGGKPGEITGKEYGNALSKYNQLVKYGDRQNPEAMSLYSTLEDGAMQWYDAALKGKLGADWKKTAEYYAGEFGDVEKLSRSRNLRQAFLAGAPGTYGTAWFDAVSRISPRFAAFEELGVPRQFTGQLFRAMPTPIHRPSFANTKELVGAFKKLSTDAERTTFLQLLPTWTQSIDKLASTAKKLYKRPS